MVKTGGHYSKGLVFKSVQGLRAALEIGSTMLWSTTEREGGVVHPSRITSPGLARDCTGDVSSDLEISHDGVTNYLSILQGNGP